MSVHDAGDTPGSVRAQRTQSIRAAAKRPEPDELRLPSPAAAGRDQGMSQESVGVPDRRARLGP